MKSQFRISILFAILILLSACTTPERRQAELNGLQIGSDGQFALAEPGRQLSFPADHGAHPDFQTEWWYFTGNVFTQDGRRFGYQLTFFRRAVIPPSNRLDRASDWAVEQVYLAHFALTDAQGDRFHSFERLERGSAGLAGVTVDPLLSAWLHDWQVEQTAKATYRMVAVEGETGLDLELVEAKPPILQGRQGYSQKGAQPGNASYYYSLPRLQTRGEIRVGNDLYQVDGWSWMDHEFSTSALADDQVGWDWFALQLDDNSEIMVYAIRKQDGRIDAYSRGIYIRPDGSARHLTPEEFTIETTATWQSPHTQANYPASWRVQIPSEQIDIEVTPVISDQEWNVSFTYWEGAVDIEGTRAGQPVRGYGYTELTGYASKLEF